MILVDTSAWIEFLRDTGSPTATAVDALLDDGLATCDVVVMEVLAGARDDAHLQSLRRLLAGATMLSLVPLDYEDAATLYRTCRREGVTVRRLVDCLIAAVAIRTGASVLHQDADFAGLARCTRLIEHPSSRH